MNNRHSVLLIHGIFRQKYVFARLSCMGSDVHRFHLKPSNAMIELDRLAITKSIIASYKSFALIRSKY